MQPNTDSLSAGSLLNRATSPTPPFWLKLRSLWAVVAANTGLVAVIAKAHPGLVPSWVATMADVISIASTSGFVHTFVAKQPDTPAPAANQTLAANEPPNKTEVPQ